MYVFVNYKSKFDCFVKIFAISGIIVVSLNSCRRDPFVIPTQSSNDSLTLAQKQLIKSQKELASFFAPIIHQDVDKTGGNSLEGKSDYITRIDFDGDWIGTNNWENIKDFPAKAAVYYSVTSTSTHHFIIYAMFHPRDWSDIPFDDEHENDLEGALVIVKRDNSKFGVLNAMVTVFHTDFYSYLSESSSWIENKENVDGKITLTNFNGFRPTLGIQAKGHGIKAYPYIKLDGDGVIYFPSSSNVGEIPSSPDDRNISYELIDIFEKDGLWDQRNNSNLFFSNKGAFVGNTPKAGANAPWNWDDSDDGKEVQSGDIANKPVALMMHYFKDYGTLSQDYTFNKYLGIE